MIFYLTDINVLQIMVKKCAYY